MKLTWLLTLVYMIPVYISFSQNVGIGVANPTRAKLELNGGVGRTAAIFGGEGVGISLQKEYPAIGFNQYFDGASSRYIGNGYALVAWYSPFTGSLNFDALPQGTANNAGVSSRLLTMDRNGHIGLGTGSTNGWLQFGNALTLRKIVLYESANNDHQYYGFGIENATLRYQVDATGANHIFYAGQGSSSSLMLMRIGGNKKVYIGEQAAGFRLGINSYDPVYTVEMVETNSKGILFVNPDYSYKNWEVTAWNYGNGDVSLTLYHNQSTAPSGWFRPDNGSYYANSDKRLKENIGGMGNVLDRVIKLKPSTYNFKADPLKNNQVGFIAQEVAQLFPSVVSKVPGREPGDPETMGIDYGGLSVVAIKAIQELQAEIDQLKQELAALKTK